MRLRSAMNALRRMKIPAAPRATLSNAEIARQLSSLAQLLTTQRANPFKVKAYRRAADTLASLGESVSELVRGGADLTQFAGIGPAIASAIREIVETGGLRQLEGLRTTVGAEVAALSEYPRLDPKRVLSAYKKLGIASVPELQAKLESGELGRQLGPRMEQHVRSALSEADQILLYDADPIAEEVKRFLLETCRANRVEPSGDYRRRVEVIGELSFLIETDDFRAVVKKLQRYGGRCELLNATNGRATLRLSAGILLTVENASPKKWGVALIVATGSDAHLEQLEALGPGLEKLAKAKESFPSEADAYRKLGLSFIEPELREGHDEVKLAAKDRLPLLVTLEDIRGELHAHSTSSDGAHTIEQMAVAARKRGYDYLGITDHSQSLKIARGVSEEKLWEQIAFIDQLNARLTGIRVLKSAEVDILADGSLDYPDALLRELDYTICSIHSRFALNKEQQTKRILRAMDNPHFTILGHATGRLLLRRTGYEIDIERVIAHAKKRGCFFEINSSPDRLDLSVAHARLAREAGIKIAICTDAHSIREFDFIRWGIDQARRAGLEKKSILNCLSWTELKRAIKR
jgi:DNA polymerase (family 10)